MKKEKYSIEFVFGNASPNSLWRMLTEYTLLEAWFANQVKVRDNKYFTFIWSESIQETERTIKREPNQVRYNWLAEDRLDTYFEFKIHTLELSNEIALEVIGFATPEEKEDAIFLWEAQINTLKRKLGV